MEEDNKPVKNHAFQHFFSIQIDSYNFQLLQFSIKSFKAKYAELARLSKKAIEYAIQADMQHELLSLFKIFIYNV